MGLQAIFTSNNDFTKGPNRVLASLGPMPPSIGTKYQFVRNHEDNWHTKFYLNPVNYLKLTEKICLRSRISNTQYFGNKTFSDSCLYEFLDPRICSWIKSSTFGNTLYNVGDETWKIKILIDYRMFVPFCQRRPYYQDKIDDLLAVNNKFIIIWRRSPA